MTSPMTRKKRDGLSRYGSKHHGIRRSSERGGHAYLSNAFQAFHFIQPAASDDGKISTWFRWHGVLLSRLFLKVFHKAFDDGHNASRNRLNGLVRVHFYPRQAGFLSKPRHLPFRKTARVSL